MALTEKERIALIAARDNIAAGRNVHLCYALNSVSHNEPIGDLWRECSRLKKFVMKAIRPYYTLDDWIAARHKRNPLTPVPNTLLERSQARIEWIDWMLGERAAMPSTATRLPNERPVLLDRNLTINSPRDRRPVRLGVIDHVAALTKDSQ